MRSLRSTRNDEEPIRNEALVTGALARRDLASDDEPFSDSLPFSRSIGIDYVIHGPPTAFAKTTRDERFRIAGSILDQFDRDRALEEIAFNFAWEGRTENILKLTDVIRYDKSKSRAILSIIPAFAEVGRLDDIRSMVYCIQDEQSKAKALAGIANSLARSAVGVTRPSGPVHERRMLVDPMCPSGKSA